MCEASAAQGYHQVSDMAKKGQSDRDALKLLFEAGREDLLKPDVFLQARVGFTRPKRSVASRVAAAVLACSPPKEKVKARVDEDNEAVVCMSDRGEKTNVLTIEKEPMVKGGRGRVVATSFKGRDRQVRSGALLSPALVEGKSGRHWSAFM
ncbi:hypothetical protein NDU88_004779 [Pleurodeles waltl]|uniref:Uncharacterized protein n=1 Tax=Pleurodeles waltl TaxID=8319 RepID=A0AAV7VJ70_PLEWA|nr:hypothetical protein NDU88_004779 [Pleurodeles waltl]